MYISAPSSPRPPHIMHGMIKPRHIPLPHNAGFQGPGSLIFRVWLHLAPDGYCKVPLSQALRLGLPRVSLSAKNKMRYSFYEVA